MADREGHHLQQDFSGGEIGVQMLMREDTALHKRSVLEMRNFFPTQQGTAARTPGTKFIQEVSAPSARIMPYITPSGAYAVALLTPKVGGTNGNLTVLDNINGVANAPTKSLVNNYVGTNGSFVDGLSGWSASVVDYVSSKGSALLGFHMEPNYLSLQLRRGHDIPSGDPNVATVAQAFVIPETTTQVIIQPDISYVANYGRGNGKNYPVTVRIRVGTTWGGSEQGLIEVTNLTLSAPSYKTTSVITGTFTAGVTYYLTLEISAGAGPGSDGNATHHPVFQVHDMNVLSLVTTTIGSNLLTAVVPYTEAQLKDVHYVQSPYTAQAITGHGVGKELVMTQPNLPPRRLYFDGTVYQYQEIFQTDATQFYLQWNWTTNGYPATCTSYFGRLVLAGSTEGTVVSPKGSSAETVWCTEVGDWGKFTDPGASEVLPTDSLTFTSIYRSQIRWAVGSKTLLLGAENFEYTASADVLPAPNDVGVDMHSTHGSNRVQPVVMGSYIMFPSEAGTKLRAMQFLDQVSGWVAPDLTLAHPDILNSKIVRMARMRNPHQMVVVVLGNGQLAMKHFDEKVPQDAWSRIDVGGQVIDACVSVGANGEDILYVLVKRSSSSGTSKLCLEAIVNFTTARRAGWIHMNSYAAQLNTAGATNVITGMGHLEGQYVQVLADYNYLGMYQVVGGNVTLVDQLGAPINFIGAIAGLPAPCALGTLPMITKDPASKKRYTSLTVRTLGSSRPIINGERSPDRDPLIPLGRSQYPDYLYDCDVSPPESAAVLPIRVEETLPVPVEVVGIFGKLSSSSV